MIVRERLLALYTFLCIILLVEESFSQKVTIEGSIVCSEKGRSDLKRTSEYIIVVPYIMPDLAVLSNEFGYYRINLSCKLVLDQSITFLYIGKSDSIEKQTLFIAREDIWNKRVKCPTKYIGQKCENFINDYFKAEAKLDSIIKKKYILSELDKESSILGVGILSTVSALILMPLAGAAGRPDSIVVDTLDIKDFVLSPQQIKNGLFLKRAFSEFSQNIGFNFTPSRNLNEVIFWNASAITLSPDNQASILTDYQRFVRLSALFKLTQELGFGIGIYWLHQNETRTAVSDSNSADGDFCSDELMINAAFSAKLTDAFRIGFSPKFIYQDVQIPAGIERIRKYSKYFDGYIETKTRLSLFANNIKTRKIDFDISATFMPMHNFRFGLSLMNLIGTELYSNENQNRNLRAVGFGVTYQNGRINIGSEINISKAYKGILACGVNYIPINHIIVNLGISSDNNKILLGINYRNLFYTFNRDDLRKDYHLFGTRFRF